jgi:ribosomal protein S27E
MQFIPDMPPAKKKAKKAKKAEDEPLEDEELVKKSVNRRKECPDCGSDNIVFDPETEQLICQDCGSIFEELPEDIAKAYEDNEDGV